MTYRSALISAIAFTAVVAAYLSGSALPRAARADSSYGAGQATSCATSTPCVEADNTSTGPGLKGTSVKGNGVFGTTKAKGTTLSNSRAGVEGDDLQTATGPLGNGGVKGKSINGYGVKGYGGYTGVFGVGTTYGVAGSSGNVSVFGTGTTSTAIAVLGSSFGIGVEGEGGDTVASDAVFASGSGSRLFRGNNSQGNDVFVVTDGGDTTVGGSLNVTKNLGTNGAIDGGSGLFGDVNSVFTGLIGRGSAEGVEGDSSTAGDAIFANGIGGKLFRGNNSHAFDVFIVDDSGNVFAHSFSATLNLRTVQRTATGRAVNTYAQQAAQPSLEDFGEAQLVNGDATVRLDPAFQNAIDRRSGYLVFVTPEGMTQGVLCVTQRTPDSFTVRENMGGHSSIAFAYRLIAKPYGSTAPRLPQATDMPAGFDFAARPKHMAVRITAPPLVHEIKPRANRHPMF